MKLNKTFRTISQILFLAIFVFLLIIGKNMLWMALFAIGVLVSIFFGRFYCGWVCQMGTLLRGMSYIKKKLRIPQIKTPGFFKQKWLRFVFFALFLGFIILMQKNGLQLFAVLIITGLSIVVSLFFHESLWHNVFCPYGSLLSLTSRFAFLKVKINEEKCISCGKCERVCPSETILIKENKKRQIDTIDCLNCGKCMEACPIKVIDYKK